MDAKIHGLLLIKLREQTAGVKAQSVSSKDLFYHMSMDIGKPTLEAVMEDGEAFVIQPQEVEHGGVEVMERVDIFDGFESKFIGGAMADAGLDAGSGQYGGETTGVVVAALGPFLEHRHAAEFGAPKDQSVLQQAALLEVPDQGC